MLISMRLGAKFSCFIFCFASFASVAKAKDVKQDFRDSSQIDQQLLEAKNTYINPISLDEVYLGELEASNIKISDHVGINSAKTSMKYLMATYDALIMQNNPYSMPTLHRLETRIDDRIRDTVPQKSGFWVASNNNSRVLSQVGGFAVTLNLNETKVPFKDELISSRKSNNSDQLTQTDVNKMYATATQLRKSGDVHQAIEIFSNLYEGAKRELGDNHPTVSLLMYEIGYSYYLLNQYQDALPFFKGSFEIDSKEFGLFHDNTRQAAWWVATTLMRLKVYQEAEIYLVIVLEASQKLYGMDDKNTVNAMYRLATNYSLMGKYVKALPLLEVVFESRKSILGLNNEDTAMAAWWLASALERLGRQKEAVHLYQVIFDIRDSLYGPNDNRTVNAKYDLAVSYCLMGEDEKALPHLKDVFEYRKSNLGLNDESTASTAWYIAGALVDLGRDKEAFGFYQILFDIQTSLYGSKDERTIEAMADLGDSYRSISEYSKAEELLLKAYEYYQLRRDSLEDKLMGVAVYLGLLYSDKNQFDKAIQYHRIGLTLREKLLGPSNGSVAASLRMLAGEYTAEGNYEQAQPFLQRAVEIAKKDPGVNEIPLALALEALATNHQKAGRYQEAEQLFRQSLEIRKKNLGETHPDTLDGMVYLAGLFQLQGKMEQASDLLVKNLAARQKPDQNPADVAIAMNNLAQLYIDVGKYSKALPLFQQALQLARDLYGENDLTVATINSNLGLLFNTQHLYDKSLAFSRKALNIRLAILGDRHPDTLLSLNNIALASWFSGDLDEASKGFSRAYEISGQVLGTAHPTTIQILNNYGFVLGDQGDFAYAASLLEKSVILAEDVLGQDHPSVSNNLLVQGMLYAKKGDHLLAVKSFQKGLSISTKVYGEGNHFRSVFLVNLAFSYVHLNDDLKAHKAALEGMALASARFQRQGSFLSRKEREPLFSLMSESFEIFLDPKLCQGCADVAMFARLNLQGLLQEMERRQSLLVFAQGPQQKLANNLRSVQQQLASMALDKNQRGRLEIQRNEIEQNLYRLIPELKPRVVSVQQIAKALPVDAVLVEFVRIRSFDASKPRGQQWGAGRYVALILHSNGSVQTEELGSAKDVEALIALALQASEQKLVDAPQLWADVSQRIIRPLARATQGTKTWFISPDGELNRVPFAALSSPTSSSLLSEVVQLRVLTTGRELLDLNDNLPSPSSQSLVVANPSFDRLASSSSKAQSQASSSALEKESALKRSGDMNELIWSPLPGTAKEGVEVAEVTGGRLLLKDDATADAVKSQSSPNILHLATHAYFLPDKESVQTSAPMGGMALIGGTPGFKASFIQGESPLLRSGIVLAGANQPNQGGSDDGYLTALEVAQLNWSGTDLVVISACESGRGEIRTGEGVFGLKRSIAVAGARSSLLSLWMVDDQATAAFMQSFYKRLKDGKGKGDALAETQKEFRNHPIAGWRHPYVWAAFQLSGDWGPVQGL